MTTTTSRSRELMTDAAGRVATVLRRLPEPLPNGPTPCSEFDLVQLTDHFLGTTAMLTSVAGGPAAEVVEQADWPERLAAQVEALAVTWSAPEAWTGTVRISDNEMPAPMVGDMVFAEILLHGWDVSRSAAAGLEVDDEIAAELLRSVEQTAELGRRMGAYGAQVPVPDDASAFDRALGAAGRDPSWRP